MATDIVYYKMTGRVLIFVENGTMVLPSAWDVAHFDKGVEPVLIETEDGCIYLKRNAIIVKDLEL